MLYREGTACRKRTKCFTYKTKREEFVWVITTENEITRYSVTLDVSYKLYNKKTKEIFLSNKVSATSDYSAAVTYTGFATEIARRDTFERLANVVAEKMITEIVTNNFSVKSLSDLL